MKKKKILFLYTELAGYFLSCLDALLANHEVDVVVVRWQVNREAPFHFKLPETVKFYYRNELKEKELLSLNDKFSPDLIICSGWTDKSYMNLVDKNNKRIPTILSMDNHWTGSLKQHLLVAGKHIFLNGFSHIWIPGKPQYSYAKKLGFKEQNILEGYYSADHGLFSGYYEKYKNDKKTRFPKRLIYVGRYYLFKGVLDMWQAFKAVSNEFPEWELWCLGAGDLSESAPKHPKIKHVGFVQPQKIESFIRDTGVFVLPSHFEPWGVAVHEFAAAGFPMICSDSVGASSEFLEEGENGYVYKAGNVEALTNAIRKMMSHSDDELLSMGEKSTETAKKITPAKWADTLMSVLN